MKSTTKIMVVAIAVLMAVSMIVAPVAARAPLISDVANGDTIYVWETGLNLNNLRVVPGAAPAVTKLLYYQDNDVNKAVLNTITVPVDTAFNILAVDVGTYTGTYRASDGVSAVGVLPVGLTGKTVNIEKPALAMDVVLSTDPTSSVDGKTLSNAVPIQFKLMSKVGNNYMAAGVATAVVKVEFTTPSGGKTTSVGGTSLAAVTLTSNQVFTAAVPLNNAAAPTESGAWSATGKWVTPAGFGDYAATSNAVTFTVESRTLSVTSEKTEVIRGNNFVTSISGEANTDYVLYVKEASLAAQNMYPIVMPGQPGVTRADTLPWPAGVPTVAAAVLAMAGETPTAGGPNADQSFANVRTKSDGTRPVEWVTAVTTDDRTFTIKVKEYLPGAKYDTVKVKVEKGSLTVTASGDASYYMGEEVTFSGTNTDSDNVYLYITGPNLASPNGVKLDAIGTICLPAAPITYVVESVKTDKTWEYKWDTAGSGLDAGTYTVYAAAQPQPKNLLTGVKYDTVSIVVRKPFITATTSAQTVAKGDKFYITGTAEGNPDTLAIWILGKNYYQRPTESVEDDGSFSHEISSAVTGGMASGQYFIVVQHPMYNGVLDVAPAGIAPAPIYVQSIIDNPAAPPARLFTNLFIIDGAGKLQGSDAAEALIQAINSPDIDDTYYKLTVLIEEPWIQINSVGQKYVGDTFTISGTTNLAVDDDLLVDVTSSSFKPTEKTQSGEFSGASGTVLVIAGETNNEWSFDVDASTFKPDEYIVNVESIQAGTTATATFDVLKAVPTTAAPVTGATTAPVTAVVTTAPATTATAAPGFGALIALIGLGAVAALVVRKD